MNVIEQKALDGVMKKPFVKSKITYQYKKQVPLKNRQRKSTILRKERL